MNPEQFARVVLLHLTGLRADLVSVESLLQEFQDLLGGAPKAAAEVRAKAKQEIHNRMYHQACAQAGVNPDPPTATK